MCGLGKVAHGLCCSIRPGAFAQHFCLLEFGRGDFDSTVGRRTISKIRYVFPEAAPISHLWAK